MATLVANLILGAMRCVYPKRVNDLVASGGLRIFFDGSPAHFLTVDAATKYSWISFGSSLCAVLIGICVLAIGCNRSRVCRPDPGASRNDWPVEAGSRRA